MTIQRSVRFPLAILAGLIVILFPPSPVRAHCDGLDGPVVSAARQALEGRDVAGVLIWVQAKDEPAIRKAFEQTLAVRKLGGAARELADTWFFETLVRIHRAGEGAPYTGLQPAGRDLGPAIPAADRALASGDVAPLVELLAHGAERVLREKLAEARTARAFRPGDVEAGRAYVARYVEFLHYVERLHLAVTTAAHGHEAETAAAEHAHD